ncbi:WD repeat-containing protein 38-like isoform X4 [Acanthaster planci]|uniref:WD repeat-containing protein 38-like isoform X4 n=1 Tax=Acanthaster planci TaxID=133434 RepID=A0A8B7XTK6_ACAPL|nr:WD repeat-containing protein 38-like isoform X4 [Acanthaster planci]
MDFSEIGAIKSVAVSSDSKFIASASYDSTVIVWRTANASVVYRLTGHSRSVETVAFSHDSRLLCSGSWDNTALVWNLKTGTAKNVLTGHKNVVQCCAFSLNDMFLVSSTKYKKCYAQHEYSVPVEYTSTIATGSWDHTVRLWLMIRDPRVEQCRILNGHTGNVYAVAFSSLGMLASGSWDKTIRLWRPRDGSLLFILDDHSGWVRALAFSPDGTILASASDDESVKIWDTLSGECAKTLQGNMEQLQTCIFSTEGALLASGAATMPNLTFKTSAADNKAPCATNLSLE